MDLTFKLATVMLISVSLISEFNGLNQVFQTVLPTKAARPVPTQSICSDTHIDASLGR